MKGKGKEERVPYGPSTYLYMKHCFILFRLFMKNGINSNINQNICNMEKYMWRGHMELL